MNFYKTIKSYVINDSKILLGTEKRQLIDLNIKYSHVRIDETITKFVTGVLLVSP